MSKDTPLSNTVTRLKALNEKYLDLSIEERVHQLYRDFEPRKVMLTSSFAATSAFFLYLFSRLAPWQKVHFINTGFHFPQTLDYKEMLTKRYNLKVIDVQAETEKHALTAKEKCIRPTRISAARLTRSNPLMNSTTMD